MEEGEMTKEKVKRNQRTKPRFPLGAVIVTRGAMRVLAEKDILSALHRHRCGDWGTANRAARRVNDKAVRYGGEIFTHWESSGFDFWIITNGDRSVTTILLPDEY
jgi:hypothetical protein